MFIAFYHDKRDLFLLVYKWAETKTQVSLRVNIPTIYEVSGVPPYRRVQVGRRQKRK